MSIIPFIYKYHRNTFLRIQDNEHLMENRSILMFKPILGIRETLTMSIGEHNWQYQLGHTDLFKSIKGDDWIKVLSLAQNKDDICTWVSNYSFLIHWWNVWNFSKSASLTHDDQHDMTVHPSDPLLKWDIYSEEWTGIVIGLRIACFNRYWNLIYFHASDGSASRGPSYICSHLWLCDVIESILVLHRQWRVWENSWKGGWGRVEDSSHKTRDWAGFQINNQYFPF